MTDKPFVIVRDGQYLSPMGLGTTHARLAYRFETEVAARRYLVRQLAAAGVTLMETVALMAQFQIKELP